MCVQICVKHSVSVSPSFMGIQFCIDFFQDLLILWHYYQYVLLLLMLHGSIIRTTVLLLQSNIPTRDIF